MVGRRLIVVGLLAGAAAAPSPASAGPPQAALQVALRALGVYPGPIDGTVGPETVAAIRAAQAHAGRAESGELDARTRRSLGPLGRPLFGSRVIRVGDFGLDVAELEFLLTERGDYRGALDGYLGPETESAVRRFQRSVGLAADGVVGPSTRAALLGSRRHVARSATGTAASYVVASGDTLTAIAARYGLTVAELARANRIDADRVIVIGARLTVPVPSLPTSLAAASSAVRARLDAWAVRLGLSVHLVRALAWMESGYQPNVVSAVGARGVLQTLPATRAYVETVLVGRSIPDTLDGDIETGLLYLKHLLSDFDGDDRLALAGWYEGEAAVRNVGIYDETRPFVADVLALSARI
jgi:peptidoglycan hydrolase-like protein with peptidoglycan-binding domain